MVEDFSGRELRLERWREPGPLTTKQQTTNPRNNRYMGRSLPRKPPQVQVMASDIPVEIKRFFFKV